MFEAIKLFFFLLIAHAFSDIVLQNEWMAKTKAEHRIGKYILFCHSIINGALVYAVTNSVELGITETFLHFLIDKGKIKGFYGIDIDQILHLLTKVGYVLWITKFSLLV